MSILVVYYSRSGVTRKVARVVASRLGADLDEIRDLPGAQLGRSWLAAVFDTLFQRSVWFEVRRDPAAYDLVVVGGPVWAGGLAAPVASYLRRFAGRFRRLAAFCTCNAPAPVPRLFAEAERAARLAPEAALQLRSRDVDELPDYGDLGRFLDTLRPLRPEAA